MMYTLSLHDALPIYTALEFSCQFRLGLLVGGELVFPGLLGRCAFLFGIPGGIDFRGHFKRAMLPAQSLTSQGDFIVTQRGTVAIFLALLVEIGRASCRERV